jgi:hypothetical protein
MLSGSLYRLFVQGGVYNKSISWIKQHGTPMGKLIRDIYREFLGNSEFVSNASKVWNERVLKDPQYGCFIDVDDVKNVYLGLYFVAIALSEGKMFTDPLGAWLHQKYGVPVGLIDSDQTVIISKQNLGTKKFQGFFQLDFNKKLYNLKDNVNKMLLCFIQFKYTGSAMVANKKFMGIF